MRDKEIFDKIVRLCHVVSARATTAGIEPVVVEQERWERDGEHLVRRTRFRPMPYVALLRREDLWRSLPQYQEVVDALLANATIAPQLDVLVGTATGGAASIGTGDLVFAFVASAFGDNVDWSVDQASLEKTYDEIEQYLYAESLPARLVVPLQGFHAPEQALPIALDERTRIEELTDDDIARALDLGVIRTLGASRVASLGQQLGVIAEFASPKVIGLGEESESVDLIMQRSADIEEIISRLSATLRLTKAGRLGLTGYLVVEHDWRTASVQYMPLVHAGNPLFYSYELDDAELAPFVDVWRLLTAEAVPHQGTKAQDKQRRRVKTAISRFAQASDRPASEDRLIDLMIAAEALFLLPNEKQELTYKLALRSAFFIEHPVLTRRQVFTHMRDAYNARSNVVHGDLLESMNLKLPDGSPTDVRAFAGVTEEMLRRAIRKALEIVAGEREGSLSDWEAAILD